jgi:hypothetical protein
MCHPAKNQILKNVKPEASNVHPYRPDGAIRLHGHLHPQVLGPSPCPGNTTHPLGRKVANWFQKHRVNLYTRTWVVHSTVPSLGLRRLRCVVLLHRKARVGQDATHVRQTTCVPQVCPAGASRGLGIKGDSRSLVTKSCARLSKTSISTACHRHRSCDLFERRNPWVGCMLVSLGAWVLGCLVGQRTYPVTGFRVCMGACVCCHARIPDTLCAVSRCTPT